MRGIAIPNRSDKPSVTAVFAATREAADKAIRTPLSNRRNKNVQFVLIEAAKLAPRHDHDLALLCAGEKQKGNSNQATLAIARKLVAYLMAVDRGQTSYLPNTQSAPLPKNPANEEKRLFSEQTTRSCY